MSLISGISIWIRKDLSEPFLKLLRMADNKNFWILREEPLYQTLYKNDLPFSFGKGLDYMALFLIKMFRSF